MYPGIPCHKLSILRQYLYFLVRGLLFTRELLNQKFTVVEFNSSLRKCMVTIIHWLTVTEICATSFVFFTIPSTHYSFMSYHRIVQVTRPVPLMKKEQITLLEYLSPPQ